jgi:hypothetical protein
LFGTVAGAVYKPVVLPIVPVPVPLTEKFANVLLRFVIVAVHWDCPLTVTWEGTHETEIVGVVVVVVELPPPPQEFRANAGRRVKTRRKRCHRISWRHM